MSRNNLIILAAGLFLLLAIVTFWPERSTQPPSIEVSEFSPEPPEISELSPNPPGTEVGTRKPKGHREDSATRAPAENEDPAQEALSPKRTPVRLYGGARVKPIYDLETNQVEGVRIREVEPGSFWEELGVDNDDVILELNGELIETPADTVALMNAMSRGYVLNLRLRTAEGRERFIDYRTPE